MIYFLFLIVGFFTAVFLMSKDGHNKCKLEKQRKCKEGLGRFHPDEIKNSQ